MSAVESPDSTLWSAALDIISGEPLASEFFVKSANIAIFHKRFGRITKFQKTYSLRPTSPTFHFWKNAERKHEELSYAVSANCHKESSC